MSKHFIMKGKVEVLQDIMEFKTKYGIKNSELAKMLNMTAQHLYHIEKGHQKPSDALKQKFYALKRAYQERYEMDCLIDWLHIQFDVTSAEWVIREILGMSFDWFHQERTSRYNYARKYWLDKLIVLECSEQRLDMGCLLSLSGSGCRLLEQRLVQFGVTWQDFLRNAINKGGKVTRIDVAIDDYVEYFSIAEVLEKIEKQEYRSRFRTIEPRYRLAYNEERNEMERVGVTVYFGSRLSRIQICMYQKNYELAKKLNKSVNDIAVKNRYELRFREAIAHRFVLGYLQGQDLAKLTLGVLFERLTLLEKDKVTMWQKWQKIVYGIQKIKLKVDAKTTNYQKQVEYLYSGFGQSLKMLEMIDKLNGWSVIDDFIEQVELKDKYKDIVRVMTAGNDLEMQAWNERYLKDLTGKKEGDMR